MIRIFYVRIAHRRLFFSLFDFAIPFKSCFNVLLSLLTNLRCLAFFLHKLAVFRFLSFFLCIGSA